MSTRRRWFRALAVRGRLALLVALPLAALTPLPASGQEAPPPSLQVVAVTHAPDGTITLSLSRTADGLDPISVSAILNGVPVDVASLEESRPDPTSVTIVVDTSGSMQGAPLASAQDAARALVERLDPDDPVAIVGFSAQPVLLSDFTTDREVTRAVLNTLVAAGDTALFDAVRLSADLLANAPTQGSRAMVLLSDGVDSGDSGDAAEGLALVAAQDIDVYAFALGSETDVEYLQRLSATGAYWEVASEEALASLFESLGNRLGATIRVDIAAPPLPIGEHTVELRGNLNGTPVTAQTTLNVTNDALLSAEVTENEVDRLVVALQTSVPLAMLDIRGVIGGVEVRPTREGTVFFDYWLLTPGSHEAEIIANVSGGLAARRTITVDIPVLEPILTVRTDTSVTPPVLNVSARVQGGGEGSVLRVLVDREVLAEGPANETLMVGAEGLDDATVELVGADATALVSESVRALSADVAKDGGGVSLMTILLGLGAVGAAGGAGFLYWRQRQAPPAPAVRSMRARPVRRAVPAAVTRDTLGQLILRTPEGSERAIPMGLKPLTVGSSIDCDVVLHSPAIRPVHARVSARPNGEFQVHGVAQSSASPYLNDRHDEWAVLSSGESIAIGDHVITLLTEAETEEVGHAIFHD
ncbi:MAG: VWA domain-containing protein [Dehalococcoidia bacterium]|nr:VWA domain-containing protein [Dehalococcoidia bacterium]